MQHPPVEGDVGQHSLVSCSHAGQALAEVLKKGILYLIW